MSEELQTRTEHSRSLEDAERYRAIESLKVLGLLTPVSELDVYHGRVKKPNEAEGWGVEPTFMNGGNDSGNQNMNDRPTLYTGSITVAGQFAEARSRNSRFGTAEAHKIISENTDATVIRTDSGYLDTLSEQEKVSLRSALKTLAIPLTSGAPIEFRDRDKMQNFLAQNRTFPMQSDDISRITINSGMSSTSVRRLSGAENARWLLTHDPSWLARNVLYSRGDDMDVTFRGEVIPISLEYVQRFFREAHIVGAKQRPLSATLGKRIDAVSYFDLDQVNTPEKIENKRTKTQRLLGGVAANYETSPEASDQESNHLRALLENPYVKPAKLVEAAAAIPKFGEIFSMASGVWEKFTLAEHTETVLNNLEENYADQLPVTMLPIMKLAILGHDIGKPLAIAADQKRSIDGYNAQYAEQFYKKLHLDSKTIDLLLAVIGEGAQLVHRMYTMHDKSAEPELKRLAKRTMAEYYEEDKPTVDQMKGFVKMTRIFQICDGGAYTDMAVTRSEKHRVYYRNSDSFNASFKSPVGPGKRDLRPKGGF